MASGCVTGWAGDGFEVAGVGLFVEGKRHLANEALGCARFAERGIERYTFVKDEAIALVVRAAALFEVTQDAARKLEDPGEAGHFQYRRRFLATDPAGAESDDGFAFHFVRQGDRKS